MPTHSQSLFEVFLTLSRIMRGLFDNRAQDMGLTYARARLLVTIARQEGATQTELANLLQIETPTLKRQLDALEEMQLAERRPSPGDARKYTIYLTGKARLARLVRFREEIEASVFEGISAEDIETTREVLARMSANAERLGAK
ncbi:MarR family winged helix-turn-helix transcriptional regulator [Paracoccus aminophilus]|uniref:Transcriptional regulator, MarR family n=1 Tax=Paracoccus aminophilus JCM 7686 TaxID=1367847 RepID=S5XVJ3_PARAH|nr:MarR family transcriptional regulator [Paracoccus aminophilus]AGT07405.1 transcriptional regulator, MarR family [Paracoccus aminophilus JCM 7686]